MIGKLTGLVDSVSDEGLILDVNGVGYLVFASARTLGRLPARGGSAGLLIETHVREDHIHLFGFAERAERDWFRLLLSVQGVGAKHALAVLGVLGPGELSQAVAAQDKTALTRANGVGPKLAGRIVSELRDKVDSIALGPAAAQSAPGANGGGAGASSAASASGVNEDAVSALTNLGYRRMEAFAAVAAVQRRLGEDAGLDALIREGLKELSQ